MQLMLYLSDFFMHVKNLCELVKMGLNKFMRFYLCLLTCLYCNIWCDKIYAVQFMQLALDLHNLHNKTRV